MSDFLDAMHVMSRAAAEAINICADDVAIDAIDEAPLLVGTLRASAMYPSNDPTGFSSADEDHLVATVSFNTVYAAAQHEGVMEYVRDGKQITWVVKRYTTPGTKSHYLEDPLKAKAARYEAIIGANVDRRLGEHFRRQSA